MRLWFDSLGFYVFLFDSPGYKVFDSIVPRGSNSFSTSNTYTILLKDQTLDQPRPIPPAENKDSKVSRIVSANYSTGNRGVKLGSFTYRSDQGSHGRAPWKMGGTPQCQGLVSTGKDCSYFPFSNVVDGGWLCFMVELMARKVCWFSIGSVLLMRISGEIAV